VDVGEGNNMIRCQRSIERRYIRTESQEIWMTFDKSNASHPFRRGFRALGLLNEVRLLPGTEFTLPSDECHESLTYVREGGLVIRHRPRQDEFLGPGSYKRAATRRFRVAGASGESPFQGAHIFVTSMASHRQDREPSNDHKYYPFSDRHGTLRLIASAEPNAESLRLQQDARVYSSILDRGHHVVYELSPGRGAWLHVVAGKVRLIDHCLEAGDGASLDDESAVSFTALESSEILLFDLA